MSKKTKMGICALCGEMSELQNSHIIPKFISDDIKRKSVTGFMRSSLNPNKRIQDGFKKYLLCVECEQRFSKVEGLFANNIFYPFRNGKENVFYYENYLNEFINSISWRAYNEFINNTIFGNNFMSEEMIDILNINAHNVNNEFKKHILNEKNNLILKNYVFFPNNVKYIHVIEEIPVERIQLIMYQGMWSDVFFEDNLFIIVSNVGGILVATTLSLFNKKNYKKYRIFEKGYLKCENKATISTVFRHSLEYIFNDCILDREEINSKEIDKIEKIINKKLKNKNN